MKKLLSILILGSLALTGCGNSEDFVFIDNNNGVIQAPVCADDAYATNANTALTVAAATGVLANDTPNGATLTFQATSANGGTITGNQDGSFTYTPAANFFGTDTFTYTLGNSGGVATCTVTVTVNAVNGFFVDAATGNDGTGNFTNGLPFATVQAAVTAAGTNQDIVVRPGTYNEQVTLLDGQRLLGSGSVLAQGAVPRPVLGQQLILANGNTVDFIAIDGLAVPGISGNNINGGTITNCSLTNITNFGIDVTSVTGNWNVSNNVMTSNTVAVSLASDTGDVSTVVMDGNVCTGNESAINFIASTNSQITAQIINNTMTGSPNPGSTFNVSQAGTSTTCFDIEGNTNDDTYRLANQVATATLQVEQLSTLNTINTGVAVATVPGGFQPATEVADGFCGF